MLDIIIGIVPKIYEFVKRLLEVGTRHDELNDKLEEVVSKVQDMDTESKIEEGKPGKKRKKALDAYFRQAKRYTESARLVLDESMEEQWMLKRMMWVPSIERHYREGCELLSKGERLSEEGLTYDEVRMRGMKLPLEEDQYMGETVRGLEESAMRAIKDGSNQCIGIYGCAGAGKTNLMKHLYNKAFEDEETFKAVFWATAPAEIEPNHGNYRKALQECVAGGMWIDLENDVVHDEVRSAGRIMARLREIGPGRAVFFLDNVREEFPAYELLGLPSLVTQESVSATVAAESEDAACIVNCVLVFTTLSKDVCNRMRCDLALKMDLLGEKEAQDLFLYEARRRETGTGVLSNREQKIRTLAVEVANQCARMPLAIIIIARSMAGIHDHREWINRLNELMGKIASIHGDEAKILEQLKFGYICLKEETVQRCFLDAANFLADDRQVSKLKIIDNWKARRLIGMDRRGEFVDDQGHVILNQLERMCLLQVASDTQKVTMNKWIWKMATNVSKTL